MARGRKSVAAETEIVDEVAVVEAPVEEVANEEPVFADTEEPKVVEAVGAAPVEELPEVAEVVEAPVKEEPVVEEQVVEEPVKVVKESKKSKKAEEKEVVEERVEEQPEEQPEAKSGSNFMSFTVSNLAIFAAPNPATRITTISGVVSIVDATEINGFVGIKFRMPGDGRLANGFAQSIDIFYRR